MIRTFFALLIFTGTAWASGPRILLDLRPWTELSHGMLKGADLFSDLAPEAAEETLLRAYPDLKSRPIEIYCAKGIRSAKVAKLLQEKGYSARSLGSFAALKRTHPLEADGVVVKKKIDAFSVLMRYHTTYHKDFLLRALACLEKKSAHECGQEVTELPAYLQRRLRYLEAEKTCARKTTSRSGYLMGCFRREKINLCVEQNGSPPLEVSRVTDKLSYPGPQSFDQNKTLSAYRPWQRTLSRARECSLKAQPGCEAIHPFLVSDLRTQARIMEEDLRCLNTQKTFMDYAFCAYRYASALNRDWLSEKIP